MRRGQLTRGRGSESYHWRKTRRIQRMCAETHRRKWIWKPLQTSMLEHKAGWMSCMKDSQEGVDLEANVDEHVLGGVAQVAPQAHQVGRHLARQVLHGVVLLRLRLLLLQLLQAIRSFNEGLRASTV